jgi:hypothetical protein
VSITTLSIATVNSKKNTVAIDGAPKKIVIIDAIGCNPQK